MSAAALATPNAVAPNKFFGRKFQLTVTLPADSSGNQQVLYIPQNSLDPEAFRIKFTVYTVFYQKAWFADIDIYNLDKFTTNQLISGSGQTTSTATSPTSTIKQGMVATLYAGYQNGAYGAIWTGPVFQARFTKEQVVDFKITLHCLLWLDPLTRTNINSTFSALTNQTDLINQIANLAFGSSVHTSVSDSVKSTQQSRGGVVFGSAKQFFNSTADDNNMQWFLGPRGFNFARIDDNIQANSGSDDAIPTTTGVRVYSPPPPAGYPAPAADGVIIGTPEQTQYGVRFRVLMDPAVQVTYPAQLVKIDNSQIIQLKKSLGEYVNVLDPTGTYIVLAATYVGDTRGDAWYTEIEGLTSVGGKWAAAQALAEKASVNH
jgi:hypothetical protein